MTHLIFLMEQRNPLFLASIYSTCSVSIRGSIMNVDKTKVIWFGAPRPPEVKYLKNRNFEWNPEYFTLLGVRFSIHIDNITDDNIQLHMDAMRNEIGQWSKTDLTPFGKITGNYWELQGNTLKNWKKKCFSHTSGMENQTL